VGPLHAVVLSACLPVSPTRNHRRGADFGKELGRLNREALFGLLELVDTLVDRPSAYARLAENLGLVLRNAAYLLNLLRAHQAPPHTQPGCGHAQNRSSILFVFPVLPAWQCHDSCMTTLSCALHARTAAGHRLFRKLQRVLLSGCCGAAEAQPPCGRRAPRWSTCWRWSATTAAPRCASCGAPPALLAPFAVRSASSEQAMHAGRARGQGRARRGERAAGPAGGGAGGGVPGTAWRAAACVMSAVLSI